MSLSSIYKKCVSGVVAISSGNGSSFSTSSGFLIDQYHIVTCCHCVYTSSGQKEKVVKVYIDVAGGTIADVDILGTDGTADIAVLRLKKPISGAIPVRWASKQPERGDQCVLIGAPYGDVQSVSNAYVRDTAFYGSGLLPTVFESLLIDGSAIGGNSGGPLFNMNGEVIGILSYGYTAVTGGTMNGAVPAWIASQIANVIINTKKNYTFGSLGIKVSPMYIDDVIHLGMDKIQGYMVVGSSLLMKQTGLKEGDIITHIIIKGKEYEVGQLNSQSCIFSLIHLNPGMMIQMKIKRGGNDIDLSLTIPSTTSMIAQNGML